MRTRRRPSAVSAIRQIIRLTAATVRAQRSIRRAAQRMPRPVPWDWAKPRLLPLLAGPYLDAGGDEPVRTVMDPGCAVVFGLDLGGALPLVDGHVAERWECTPDQIRDVAMANLRTRAATIGSVVVTGGTLSGRIVRLVRGKMGWESSLLLVPDELMRLLGEDDQVIAAPGRATLISFPIDTPAYVIGDIAVDFERREAWPLMLDPFVLLSGRLHWQVSDGEDDLLD